MSACCVVSVHCNWCELAHAGPLNFRQRSPGLPKMDRRRDSDDFSEADAILPSSLGSSSSRNVRHVEGDTGSTAIKGELAPSEVSKSLWSLTCALVKLATPLAAATVIGAVVPFVSGACSCDSIHHSSEISRGSFEVCGCCRFPLCSGVHGAHWAYRSRCKVNRRILIEI